MKYVGIALDDPYKDSMTSVYINHFSGVRAAVQDLATELGAEFLGVQSRNSGDGWIVEIIGKTEDFWEAPSRLPKGVESVRYLS